MSYIDSHDHEYIGCLGYLPIYRPLQNIEGDKWEGYYFSANPRNLILGGGCGEHPGLIVHKLECIAAKFLYDQITEEEEEKISKKDTDYLIDLCYADEILEFCSWSVNNYASLKEMAGSTTFITPLGEDEEVEEWLCKSLGELVFFSLRDLNPEYEKLLEIFGPFGIEATMRNVACPPPDFPACGGRRISNGKVVWGLNRWEVKL